MWTLGRAAVLTTGDSGDRPQGAHAVTPARAQSRRAAGPPRDRPGRAVRPRLEERRSGCRADGLLAHRARQGRGGRGAGGWKCHCVRLHLLSSDSGVGEGATYPGNKYDKQSFNVKAGALLPPRSGTPLTWAGETASQHPTLASEGRC